MNVEQEFARLVLAPFVFTADDVTNEGSEAIDPDHTPNGAQSGIGRMFQIANRKRYIEWTGDVVPSKAPHRRKGIIRVWRGTAVGRAWARRVLGLGDA